MVKFDSDKLVIGDANILVIKKYSYVLRYFLIVQKFLASKYKKSGVKMSKKILTPLFFKSGFFEYLKSQLFT